MPSLCRLPRSLVVMLSAALCFTFLMAAPAFAQTFPIDEDLPRLTGMAWDPEDEVLYTVSDDDDLGTVRVLDSSGQVVEEVAFDDEMISVQAVALHTSGLYVGDIGNADLDRESVAVFRLSEATTGLEPDRFEFVYPDDPQDAAAMAISGIGRLWFVTSGDDPAFYNASLDPSSSVVNQLTRMADAPAGVTDAAFLDDGTTMVLRTASGVQLYDAVGLRTTDETSYDGGRDGESIAAFDDDQMLVGDAEQIRIEPLPSGFATVVPEPVPTPSEEPEPTPTETTEEPGQGETTEPTEVPDDQESRVERGGTIRALMGAAALALVAGAVVFLAGRRKA